MLVVICTRFYLCSKSNPLLFVGESKGEELITAEKYKRVINSPGMRRHARERATNDKKRHCACDGARNRDRE